MPPRFAYWTIILEGAPTAFRSQHREDLLPTLKQLQGKHPGAEMKWFARGRLWATPEEAQAARGAGERRGADWRPGGEHRDPRARFDIPRDEKRRRFAARMRGDDPRARRDAPAGKPQPRPDDRNRRPPAGPRPDDRNRRPAAGSRPPWNGRPDREGGGRKPAGPGGPRDAWRDKTRHTGRKPPGRGNPGRGGSGGSSR